MSDELTRLARNAVQLAVGAVVAYLTAWLTMKTGIVFDDGEITVQVTLYLTPFITWAVSALVAQIEKVVPFVGLLNGPRRKVNYDLAA